MNQTTRIFLACAFGAFIGTLVALQMSHMFWWIGALAGAGVAYVGYNLNEIAAAISIAWRHTTSWRPDYEWWKAYLGSIKVIFYSITDATLVLVIGFVVLDMLIRGATETTVDYAKDVGSLCVMFSIFMTLVCAIPSSNESRAWLAKTASYPVTNPVKFCLWSMPKGILHGVLWLVIRIPAGFKVTMTFFKATAMLIPNVASFAKRFSVELFRLVHSELRLLCAVDAALGTTIGYFTGNAIIGALAGGLLGVVNYEIITVRVLKLVGAKSVFR